MAGEKDAITEFAFGHDTSETRPHAFIQWKGTQVCMDFYCACGKQSHLHGDFVYFIKCHRCGRTFQNGMYIAMREVPASAVVGKENAVKVTEPSMDEDDA